MGSCQTRHPDLVKRVFAADAPHQLWVTDLTFVATWAGVAYVCFIIDVFSRMIVGWRVASHMRTETVLEAIEMARWSRGQQLPGLRCHSDAGSQGRFNRSSQHFEIMEVCDGSSSTVCGSGPQTEVEVARSPEVSTAGRGCVLGLGCNMCRMTDIEVLRLESRGVGWVLAGESAARFGLVEEYLSHLLDRNYSPATVRSYGYDLLSFCR